MFINNLLSNVEYEKRISDLRLERFAVENHVCRNKTHKHIMANTYSCLQEIK